MDLMEENMWMIGGLRHWLVLNPPNMCLMMRAGYAMLLFECLWLELCLIVELTLDFADFLGTSNGNC